MLCQKNNSFLSVVLLLLVFVLPGCGDNLTDFDHLQKAKDFQDVGDLKSAEIELKNAAVKNPNNAEVRLILGQIYLAGGRMAFAEKELSKAIELGVTNPSVKLDLMESKIGQGDYKLALRVLEGYQFSDKGLKARWLALKAYAHLGLDNLSLAKKLFMGSIETFENDNAQVGLVSTELKLGELESVKKRLQQLLESYPNNYRLNYLAANYYFAHERDTDRALELITNAIAQKKTAEAKVFKAQMHTVKGELDQAALEIEAVLSDSPEYLPALSLKAKLKYQQKKYSDAKEVVITALSIAPMHAQNLFILGAVHYKNKEFEQARQFLQKSVGQNSIQAAKLLASIHIENNDMAEAENLLVPLVSKYPNDTELLKLAYTVYSQQGNHDAETFIQERLLEIDPDSVEAKLLLTDGLIKKGELDTAIQILEETLQEDYSQVKIRALLMRTYLDTQRYDKALKLAVAIKNYSPKDVVGWNYIGLVHYRQAKWDQAIENFERALTIDAYDPQANSQLALIARTKGDFERAHNYYDTIFEKKPNHFTSRIANAALYAEQLDQNAVIEQLEAANRVNPSHLHTGLLLTSSYLKYGQSLKALPVLSGLDSLNSTNPLFLAMLARAQLNVGLYDSSLKTLSKLDRVLPDRMDVKALEAHALMLKGAFGDARAALDEALSMPGGAAEAELELIRYFVLTKDFESAEELISKTKEKYPEDYRVYSRMGELAFAKGDYTGATAFFRESLTKSALSETIGSLGKALLKAGETEQMFITWNSWLKQFPKDRDVRYLLASAHKVLGDKDAALKEFKVIVSENETDIIALNELAWLIKTDAPREAMDYAEKAYKLAPNTPQIIDTLGVILMEKGAFEESIDLLEKAVNLNPTITHRLHLAQALYKNDKLQEAKVVLESVLNDGADPEDVGYKEVRQLLLQINQS